MSQHHLENSGSQVLEKVFADCLGQRVASDLGGDEENQLYARESVSNHNFDFVFFFEKVI